MRLSPGCSSGDDRDDPERVAPIFLGGPPAPPPSLLVRFAAALTTHFRQWNTICQVRGSAGDEYFIQISTNHGSAGHNRFALRAVTSAGSAASQVKVAGNTYMGIYANVGGGQTSQFYLARVPTAAAGHALVLNFYDIGDAGAPGQLRVVPSTDSNVARRSPGASGVATARTARSATASTLRRRRGET